MQSSCNLRKLRTQTMIRPCDRTKTQLRCSTSSSSSGLPVPKQGAESEKPRREDSTRPRTTSIQSCFTPRHNSPAQKLFTEIFLHNTVESWSSSENVPCELKIHVVPNPAGTRLPDPTVALADDTTVTWIPVAVAVTRKSTPVAQLALIRVAFSTTLRTRARGRLVQRM